MRNTGLVLFAEKMSQQGSRAAAFHQSLFKAEINLFRAMIKRKVVYERRAGAFREEGGIDGWPFRVCYYLWLVGVGRGELQEPLSCEWSSKRLESLVL